MNIIIFEFLGDKDDYSELIKGKGKVFDKLRWIIIKFKD